jgi:phosphatidylethanolamine-binding protein (PEBP) family uncharacterized protein
MRRPLKAISSTASASGAVLLAAIALAGCGSSGGTAGGGSATTIPIATSAVEGGELSAHYTCDGANVSPPLKWGKIPAGPREIVLFAIGKGEAGSPASTIEWAMAGLKPNVHELAAGKVPKGAFLEEASDGKRHYSICPPKGHTRIYAFAIYAVPEKIIVTHNVDGATLYHNLAEGKPEFRAPAVGELTASYTRK